ncbi:SDR family oxidoreductase [Psychroflexus sp. ALD_RP9]|uniref:SDR family oxidoreductase n=1 Tax=Psychroflexus sp. ALD_RP9 TaxID=2777186 RepID=UPI001A8EB35D|nr:SDR family oxidoreductase [Psychroflexus sp. ALD_RP9]QSS97402.1 SDR family oxidoreductase [Psychroflexus sp. ALD_RP9]
MPQDIVFITGASSGIGKSIGEHLAKHNYKVYGTSRNPKHSKNNGINFIQLDVTSSESINKAINEIIKQESKIDVLINNAGVGITGPVEEIPNEEMFKVFQTNYFGPVQLINSVLPYMRQQNKGFIINITSIAGFMGLPFRGHYSASKGAFETITEAYRLELRNTNIKLTNIAPGDFATNIASGRYHSPVNNNSFYKNTYQKSLDLMNEHVDHGSNPEQMAKKVHQILLKSKPKIHYKVGSYLQKISPFLKAILPDKTYENLLANHYKL